MTHKIKIYLDNENDLTYVEQRENAFVFVTNGRVKGEYASLESAIVGATEILKNRRFAAKLVVYVKD